MLGPHQGGLKAAARGEGSHGSQDPAPSVALSDTALISAIQQGHLDAFELLVERYRDRVYRLAYGMTHTAVDAEDVVQDTFLKIFRYAKDFRGESSPRSWIFRIAVNTALMRLRQQRRKPWVGMDEQDVQYAAKNSGIVWPVGVWARQPDDVLLNRELSEHIETAIRGLPEKYRAVVLLRDVEGQSNEETAQSLGITVATVKSRLHRSRLYVRQAVEKYFQGGR